MTHYTTKAFYFLDLRDGPMIDRSEYMLYEKNTNADTETDQPQIFFTITQLLYYLTVQDFKVILLFSWMLLTQTKHTNIFAL